MAGIQTLFVVLFSNPEPHDVADLSSGNQRHDCLTVDPQRLSAFSH
jgi:hypothetical protein